MRDLSSMRICPGCGLVNPASAHRDAFTCASCGWEVMNRRTLYTLGELASDPQLAGPCPANLQLFTRAILEAANGSAQ